MPAAQHPELAYPVHSLIEERWSPRAFSDKPLRPEDLRSLFEAARWAASSMNAQPWRFVAAPRTEPALFEGLLGCLVEKNQSWAKAAQALVLTVAVSKFEHNQQPNRHAFYDLGQAAAQLVLQATALGISVHQMGGFSVDKARALYGIPADFEPVSVLALGYLGDPAQLPPDLAAREGVPRVRRPQTETVFAGHWGERFSG
jgi:nitroreductase